MGTAKRERQKANRQLRLEELAGAPVSCIGVGPGRDQTIVLRDVLAARR